MNSPTLEQSSAKPKGKWPSLHAIDRSLAERSLLHFVRQAWHIVEPGTPFTEGKHIEAITIHLEAVTRRSVRNLIINIPPRFTKSLLVSVFWPVWTWIQDASQRWIFSSYAKNLSVRDSLKRRRIIDSPWFQSHWGERFQFLADQNAKDRYENDKTGFMISTSVDGAVTGEGGDYVVTDDPISVNDSNSPAVLGSTISWWDEVMSTRLNDQRTGCKVVIMQRVAEGDLTGHLLVKGGYTHLRLPMRFEASDPCETEIGWKDWRTKEGELLCPDRMEDEDVHKLELALGAFGSAGQLQQRPVPRGGFKFRREWFKIVREAPADCQWVRAWDMAATAPAPGKQPDWTAGPLVGLKKGQWFIKDLRRMQGTPMQTEALIQQTAKLDTYEIPVAMEQEPGSSGVTVIDHYQRLVLIGFNFTGIKTTGSKELRADPVSSAAEAGNVHIVEADWNGTFLSEFESFAPNCLHDDIVDGVSLAFQVLAGLGSVNAVKIDTGLRRELPRYARPGAI